MTQFAVSEDFATPGGMAWGHRVGKRRPRKTRRWLYLRLSEERGIGSEPDWHVLPFYLRSASSDRRSTVTEAIRAMKNLGTDVLGESGLSERTKDQVRTFLDRVTDHKSPFVTIVPDDEGVAVLHWAAGNVSLQVDVGEDGPEYVWLADGDSRQSATNPEAVHNIAERTLKRIGERLEESRPGWRDEFRYA